MSGGVAVLAITDGRDDYLGQTIAALESQVSGPIVERWLYDDTGNPGHHAKLADWYPHYTVFGGDCRRGFGGAIAHSWLTLTDLSRAKWVLHWEDDFVPTRPVDLADLIALSEAQPHLAQVALRRQAWGAEVEHGGFMEAAPSWYTERTDGTHTWVETRRNLTTNPSLYRRALCSVGWPEGANSEGRIGFILKEETGLPWGIPPEQVAFGFLGGMESGRDWIHHIGHIRAGTGY